MIVVALCALLPAPIVWQYLQNQLEEPSREAELSFQAQTRGQKPFFLSKKPRQARIAVCDIAQKILTASCRTDGFAVGLKSADTLRSDRPKRRTVALRVSV